MEKYYSMPGGVLNKTQSVIAGEEIERITNKHGCCKPKILVKESKRETAPCHPFFTWDNSVAADKCREDEARSIIRSVRIVRDEYPPQEQPVIRAFVNVVASDSESDFEGHGYIPVSRAANHAEYAEQVLSNAKKELQQWQHRYLDYQTFFKSDLKRVSKAISKIR
jgi:hypothetical protein